MNFKEIFPKEKAVLAMLHLRGDSHADIMERARREADLFFECGVDAVIVEDYFGSEEDVEAVLKWLQAERPHYCYGVNVLDQFARTYELAEKYGARFMQVDSICGHLVPEEDAAYEKETKAYHDRGTVLIMGGVRFKHKDVLSGRSLEEDLKLGMERCDAIVVTGVGTGVRTEIEKIRQFRAIMGDFPLIVGAGLTPVTAEEQLSVGDGGIVGSCLKEGGKADADVSRENTLKFMEAVKALRKE